MFCLAPLSPAVVFPLPTLVPISAGQRHRQADNSPEHSAASAAPGPRADTQCDNSPEASTHTHLVHACLGGTA